MLHDFYSQWGELVDCRVMRSAKKWNNCRAYAEKYMIDAAMNACPHFIDGKQVVPEPAMPAKNKSRLTQLVTSKHNSAQYYRPFGIIRVGRGDGLLLNPSDNAVVCGNWCNNRASSGQQDLGYWNRGDGVVGDSQSNNTEPDHKRQWWDRPVILPPPPSP